MEALVVILGFGCLYLGYKWLDWWLRFRGLLWWVAVEKEYTAPNSDELFQCILRSVRHDINKIRYGHIFKL